MKQIRVKKADQVANWTTPNIDYEKVAIHLPGLPNKPTPIPGITQFLVNNGYAVLQPHYPGTYDSGGGFNPYKAHECIAFWKNEIENGKLYDVKEKILLQVGDKTKHSRYIRDAYNLTFRTDEPDIIEEFFTVHSKGELELTDVPSITECFIVSPGSDPTGDPEVAQRGSRTFIEQFPERFKIIGSLIARHSGHGVHEMISDETVNKALQNWL